MADTARLGQELADAEARVAQLKRQIAQGTCGEVGHDWKHVGGCSAACCEHCGCSVPVYTCTKCGDCDYGDNDEADRVRGCCNEGREP